VASLLAMAPAPRVPGNEPRKFQSLGPADVNDRLSKVQCEIWESQSRCDGRPEPKC